MIAFHREFLKGTPDELDTTVGFLNSPEGVPLVGIVCVFAGDPKVGKHLLEPLRKFAPPLADLLRPTSYLEVQQLFDAAVPIGDRGLLEIEFCERPRSGAGRAADAGCR